MDNSGRPAKIPRSISSNNFANDIINSCNYVFDHEVNQLIKQEIKEEPLEIKEEVDDEMKTNVEAKNAEILQLQEENTSLKMEKKEIEQKNSKLEASILELQSKLNRLRSWILHRQFCSGLPTSPTT